MPFRDDPDHWRERAAQVRALATQSNDLDAMSIMLRLADDYDEVADRAEKRAQRTTERGALDLASYAPGVYTEVVASNFRLF